MKRALSRLGSVRQTLLDTLSPLDSKTFQTRPAEDEWSVGEIVQHLCLVEERVVSDLNKAIEGGPQHLPFLRRFMPTSIVSWRLVRVKSPRAVTPEAQPVKEIAVERLKSSRAELEQFCRDHDEARIRTIVFRHPFLGPINGVATVSFVGYHERRHLKQIREVLQKLK